MALKRNATNELDGKKNRRGCLEDDRRKLYTNRYSKEKKMTDDGIHAKTWWRITQLNDGEVGRRESIKRKIQNQILKSNNEVVTSYKIAYGK